MLPKLCLYATVVLHALSVSAALGDPFSLRIYTPVDSDYYIKTLREDWTIDSYDKAHFADLKDAEKGIPNQKKAKYSVSGVIDWTVVLSESTPVRKRAFWVGRGDSNAETRDLLKCIVSPKRWQDEDMWLYLGPEWSFTDIGGCDTLQVGWLKCTKAGDYREGYTWDDKLFVEPRDDDFPYNKGCGKN